MAESHDGDERSEGEQRIVENESGVEVERREPEGQRPEGKSRLILLAERSANILYLKCARGMGDTESPRVSPCVSPLYPHAPGGSPRLLAFLRCEMHLLDHLIGTQQNRLRHREAVRIRGLEVEDHIDLHRLLRRHLRRPTAMPPATTGCCARR
jgi:hypothetical protein